MLTPVKAHRKSVLFGFILLLLLAVGMSSSQPEPAQELSTPGLSTPQQADLLSFATEDAAPSCRLLDVDNPFPVGDPFDYLMPGPVYLNCIPCAQSCGSWANMCSCYPLCLCCLN